MRLTALIDHLSELRESENCGEFQVGQSDAAYTFFDTITDVEIRDGVYVCLIGEA